MTKQYCELCETVMLTTQIRPACCPHAHKEWHIKFINIIIECDTITNQMQTSKDSVRSLAREAVKIEETLGASV